MKCLACRSGWGGVPDAEDAAGVGGVVEDGEVGVGEEGVEGSGGGETEEAEACLRDGGGVALEKLEGDAAHGAAGVDFDDGVEGERLVGKAVDHGIDPEGPAVMGEAGIEVAGEGIVEEGEVA